MNRTGPVRVQLEIEHAATTISGQLAVDGGRASSFYGWLELISALERAADTGPSDQKETT